MAYILVLSKTVTLKKAGVVKVSGTAYQSFPAGGKSFGFQLYIDGTMVLDTGYHTATDDFVPLLGVASCAAGDRTVQLYWAGDTTMRLDNAYLVIEAFNNVAGA